MNTNVLYASAHESLMKILSDISACEDGAISRRASVAMRFADELKNLYVQAAGGEFVQPTRLDSHQESDLVGLSRRYSLLRDLGLSMKALVAFARSEGLHEIDVIKIIRDLTGLDLVGAKAMLDECERKMEPKN